jgi:hypothetical protein
MSMRALKDVMPGEFQGGEYRDAASYKHRDVQVVAVYEGDKRRWPGKEKNVMLWASLVNGRAVGFNENVSRGWSFPLIKFNDPKLSEMLTADSVAKAIGIPTKEWPGKCYQIACAMLKANLVKGRACYGHYLGDMSKSELFAGRAFTHHGWIETPDGGIVDPTRWVFDAVDPYIFESKSIPNEYDEGGNKLLLMTQRPVPDHEPEGRVTAIPDGEGKDLMMALMGRKEPQSNLCLAEEIWLGNLSLMVLKEQAALLYQTLVDMGCRAMIPYDNRLKILGK